MNRYIALQKIIELGSFTKAADELGYTQSSISQMIASLENELSIRLLIRSRHGIRLTTEGAELYPYIEQAIFKYRSVIEKSNEIKGLETGVVRVGTVSSVTCHWLPQLISGFKEIYPNVQFVFHQGDYSQIADWIYKGQIDFGFLNPAAAPGLKFEPVKSDEMLVILPQNHRLVKKDFLSLDDIAEEPFIMLEEGEYSEPIEAFKCAGITPNIRYTLHDDYAIMTMVESGLGVSILAELVLKRMSYNITCIPVNPPIIRNLAVAYKDKETIPIASRRFIDFITGHKDELP